MIQFVPYQISFDISKLMTAIAPYVTRALNSAEDRLIDEMQRAIDETSSAPTDWREELKGELRHVETVIKNDIITYVTGVQYNVGGADWLRAMVITYGMGELGLNSYTIYAGPEGRMVWDGDLATRIPSRVKTEHPIPDSWNHAGGDFVGNAMRNLEVLYKDICEDAFTSIPASVFSSCIQVKTR